MSYHSRITKDTVATVIICQVFRKEKYVYLPIRVLWSHVIRAIRPRWKWNTSHLPLGWMTKNYIFTSWRAILLRLYLRIQIYTVIRLVWFPKVYKRQIRKRARNAWTRPSIRIGAMCGWWRSCRLYFRGRAARLRWRAIRRRRSAWRRGCSPRRRHKTTGRALRRSGASCLLKGMSFL